MERGNRRKHAVRIPAAAFVVHVAVDDGLSGGFHVTIQEQGVTGAIVTFTGGFRATATAMHIVVATVATAGIRPRAGWFRGNGVHGFVALLFLDQKKNAGKIFDFGRNSSADRIVAHVRHFAIIGERGAPINRFLADSSRRIDIFCEIAAIGPVGWGAGGCSVPSRVIDVLECPVAVGFGGVRIGVSIVDRNGQRDADLVEIAGALHFEAGFPGFIEAGQ